MLSLRHVCMCREVWENVVITSCMYVQGGMGEWRQKLDTQRGAVLATELKNNGCKLAKWTVASVLSGSEYLKIG